MIENRPVLTMVSHMVLILGCVLVAFPLFVAIIASTHTSQEVVQAPMTLLPGSHALSNYRHALFDHTGHASVSRMLWVSLVCALGIAVGKILLSLLAAFAVVFFRFPLRGLCFALIFVTLMLPVEVRIAPTFQVVAGMGLTNTFAGLILPMVASATATFLFRQFFMTVPNELVEAARVDGASPMRFFWDILLPLSRTSIAALFVIQFTYGWNQYLWPLVIKTDESMTTVVVGLKSLMGGTDAAADWGVVMAAVVLALLPPLLVVLAMQKWFVKGLVETEK